ncbi:paraquat-inducible protein A [Pusillimonas noertemannii]|uniref:Paraquat-inducible protein A n=1 Tax=Pusillimonas noertemannii TaxID=305977 RepID=A0A2U1CJA5_9BURK|nr:PqiA/YebS family transporter subunit [Pusillimonas noertemannii]NYT70135.1 PqiA/YebS family transporter subunit [Pusillimonas noertemannii]PVY61081.1 paraquat-inducible protein A [Pusillimonas noertemannii]TFL08267.1 PqiA/YebS family transporter subunit [Pusillimonas noertemannii]
MSAPPLLACRHCDRLHVRQPIEAGAIASCTRCGYVLYRQSGLTLHQWTALAVAAAVIFAIANYFPIAELSIQGVSVRATLPYALWITWQQGHASVALATALFAFAFPLGQILFLFWALRAIATARLPADFKYGMRMLDALAPWSMLPVLLLGILVAMVKLLDLASVTFGPGLWAFAVSSFMLTALGRVSAQRLWRYAEDDGLVERSGLGLAAGEPHASCHACGFVQSAPAPGGHEPCRRCGARVHRRKPESFSRAWAFVIAAAVLYIPANVLPVMIIHTPTGASPHTILSGVIEFWRLGSWDLALIVFVASVVVPLTKLLALSVLMLRRRRWRGRIIQRQRTRLYELVEFVGQWSMLDVFVVVLLSAMANFPGFSQITAGGGAVAFGAVVILTIFAAMSYDPRLGWDADPEEAGELSPQAVNDPSAPPPDPAGAAPGIQQY